MDSAILSTVKLLQVFNVTSVLCVFDETYSSGKIIFLDVGCSLQIAQKDKASWKLSKVRGKYKDCEERAKCAQFFFLHCFVLFEPCRVNQDVNLTLTEYTLVQGLEVDILRLEGRQLSIFSFKWQVSF